MNYRLIVIERSLKEKSILKNYKILSKTLFERGTPQESLMFKIEIPVSEIDLFEEKLKHCLMSPYYAHFYHENLKKNSLIVVFNEKIFYAHKSNCTDAFNYGISHGVTKEQMDIKPRDIQEERW